MACLFGGAGERDGGADRRTTWLLHGVSGAGRLVDSGMCFSLALYPNTHLPCCAQALLPYALAFAAGAMIFVVCDDLLAEVHRDQTGHSSSSLASWGVMAGFTVMMILDVALG